MRLLHFAPSGKLLLTDFHGKRIPPYAILSHRWEAEEVLIEHVGKDECQNMRGYRKIKFCADQAALDGLTYFWIDTCCIDKHNSIERANSIRSMFVWYQDAAKCYVFLSDVPETTDWETAFRSSVWFKRGWTLQELIAPREIGFFTYEGHRLGDKTSLEPLVHEITGIPLEVLRNCPLQDFSISERRNWVANRETTEGEDMVYCLFGVLGISMPINYGEGEGSASMRLQERLSGNSAPSTVPFLRNNKFVGREPQLASLGDMISKDKHTPTIVIQGPGGTGKSQLALELVHQTRQKMKTCSAFWVDASDMNSLHQGYSNIAENLNISGWDDEKADVKTLVAQYLSTDVAGQWLLIFDGMDDHNFEQMGLSATQVDNSTNYLPQSKFGTVIFTTTSLEVAEIFSPRNTVQLEELTPDAALIMLKHYLRNPIPPLQIHSAELLLGDLSYLPLAIIQAAACMNTAATTVQEYRQTYLNQHGSALQHGDDSLRDTKREDDAKSPVATTVRISVDLIRHDTPLAAEYLFLAASLDRKDIPDEIFNAYPRDGMKESIKVLSDYALVTRRTADSALDLHRLVHHALQGLLAENDSLDEWTHNAIKALNVVFPQSDHGNRSKWRRLFPHVRITLSRNHTKEMDMDRLFLMSMCYDALHEEGVQNERTELCIEVVELSRSVLGEEHGHTLLCMSNLALTYRDLGRRKEAEELAQRVLEIQKRVLGEEHPYTLISMNNLALTYNEQDRWDEAEALGRQMLEIGKRVFGEENPSTLASMSNLASTYRKQGRRKEAEELMQQVVDIGKRVLGEDHPGMVTSMNNLAVMYGEQGRWGDAEELYKEVLEISRRGGGEEHPDTLNCMYNLATYFNNQGRLAESIALMETVVKTRQKVLGLQHFLTRASAESLDVWREEATQYGGLFQPRFPARYKCTEQKEG
jgi:tetratricopeptide (TPR) repeat protein